MLTLPTLLQWELIPYAPVDVDSAVLGSSCVVREDPHDWLNAYRRVDLTRCETCGAFHNQESAMLENLERKMLLAELEGVLSKLKDQGIEPGLTDDEINNLDVKSLREAVRRFEKLARTPGGR